MPQVLKFLCTAPNRPQLYVSRQYAYLGPGHGEQDPCSIVFVRNVDGCAPGTVLHHAAGTYTNRALSGVTEVLRLRQSYRLHCAFCQCALTQVLDAAHIVPWTMATEVERGDPANGLLLCVMHHRLFDAGCIELGTDLVVRVSPEVDTEHPGNAPYFRALAGREVVFQPEHRERALGYIARRLDLQKCRDRLK